MPTTAAAAGADAGAAKNPNTFDVFVAYNGLEKSIPVNVNEPVRVLLNHAIQEFRVTNQPHILAIFNAAGVELSDATKIGDAGIKSGEHLLMRPSAVKGG